MRLCAASEIFLFRHAFIYIHFPVLCEPSLSATVLSQTIFHRVFQPFAQTAHVRFHSRKRVHTRLSEKNRTQRLTRRNRGVSDRGCYHYPRSVPHVHKHPRAGCQNGKLCRFWGLDLVYSRRTQRACGTAMRSCASLFRGVAAPPGCVIFFASAEIAVCTSGAHDFPRVQGGERYHYPRCALHVLETLDGRLSKGLICRFLRLPSSTPCAVTFSANMQISLSVISVANSFALWYDKFHKSGLFGDEGEPE